MLAFTNRENNFLEITTVSHSFIVINISIDSIQDEEGQKKPPPSFSSLISTNVEISPKYFLIVSFNRFVTLV